VFLSNFTLCVVISTAVQQEAINRYLQSCVSSRFTANVQRWWLYINR